MSVFYALIADIQITQMFAPDSRKIAVKLTGLPERGTQMYTTTCPNYENQNEEIENHAHDLIHELSLRLNCLRSYDQYIANASGQPEIQEFWRESKCQMQSSLDQLNRLIRNHVNFDTFS